MFFFFASAPSFDARMVKKRKDDELLRGGRSDITHVFIFPSFLLRFLSPSLSTQSFSSFLERVVVVVVCRCCCQRNLKEKEREYISFRFSQKRKLKRTIWHMEKHTFKMRSLFFSPRQPFRAEGMKTERWKEKTTKRGSGDGRSLRSRSF